jgi:hypothetical protein
MDSGVRERARDRIAGRSNEPGLGSALRRGGCAKLFEHERQPPPFPSQEEPPWTPSTPLAGRTSIVTGASSGIGRAIAAQLGAAGSHVFLIGRTTQAMEASKKKIEEAGGQARVIAADVRDVAQVQGFVDEYNTIRPHSSLGYRPPAPEAVQPKSAVGVT